jgi:VanZ family protein
LSVRRWLPPLIWAGVIVVATSLPGNYVPLVARPLDKVVHFSLYAVFAALLAWQALYDMSPWRAIVIAAGIAIGFGAADEWHQRFVPGRAAAMADWLADILGAITGALSAAWYRRMRTLKAR